MKMISAIVFCVALAARAMAVGNSLEAKAGSAVWLVGDSTLHPFTCRTTQLQVSGTGASSIDTLLQSGALKTFDVVIPDTGLKSKESSLDKNMYKALKSESCPNISFHLSDYTFSKSTAVAGNINAKVNGTLTIACQEKPVTLQTDLAPGSDALHVQGQYTLLMTDYGIKPPTMLMGTIKVKDPVVIHFDLQLGFANP